MILVNLFLVTATLARRCYSGIAVGLPSWVSNARHLRIGEMVTCTERVQSLFKVSCPSGLKENG